MTLPPPPLQSILSGLRCGLYYSFIHIYRNVLNITTLDGGKGEKKHAFKKDLGIVSVIKFKTRVCLNEFCPKLLSYIHFHPYVASPPCHCFKGWEERDPDNYLCCALKEQQKERP